MMNFILLICLGGILIYFGIAQGGISLLFTWLGISFFLTGLGHVWIGSQIYGKDKIGQIPLWSKIIHLPFLLYTLGT